MFPSNPLRGKPNLYVAAWKSHFNMTNVSPSALNYDHYPMSQYDRDIVRSIPGHREVHECIDAIVQRDLTTNPRVLELGVGTGLTAKRILQQFPHADYTAIDFSQTMLQGAREKLGNYSVQFILGDYSIIDLPQHNDLVVSVLSIHHQATDEDKKRLFQRIYDSLKDAGQFIFGDLVTYRNPVEAAVNEALHVHHLVEKAADEQSLREWAHHHKFLNSLAPLESQREWLYDAGFKAVDVVFKKFNTALVYAKK